MTLLADFKHPNTKSGEPPPPKKGRVGAELHITHTPSIHLLSFLCIQILRDKTMNDKVMQKITLCLNNWFKIFNSDSLN